MSKKALSLFSGAGGDTLGLENAGYKVTHFSEMNKDAIQTHLSRFPGSTLLEYKGDTNLKNIPNSVFSPLKGKIDIVFAGFPCFIKNTLVLTDKGYKEIENVSLNEKLLTHTGTFHNILNLQRKKYSGKLYDISLKYHPETITCTEEHPFYVCSKNNKDHPEWKNASQIAKEDYIGMVINTKSDIPNIPNIKLDQPNQWYIMGYFIGGNVDKNEDNISTFDKNFLEFLESLKEYKFIPEWIHNAPSCLVKEFLNGYYDSLKNNISLQLAYGLQRLYLKIGHIVGISKKYEIEYNKNDYDNNSFIQDNYVWYSLISLEKREIKNELVYNFEVENDNSYVVCNVIAHNCQGFSHAGKKKENDPRNELVHEFVRVVKVVQPEWIIGENVKGLLSRKGKDPNSGQKRNVIDIIVSLFEETGYKLTYQVVDASDHGVPQMRKRLIIIGKKGEEYPIFPILQKEDKIPLSTIIETNNFLNTNYIFLEKEPNYDEKDDKDSFWTRITDTPKIFNNPHPNLVRLVNGIRGLTKQEREDRDEDDEKIKVEIDGLLSYGRRKSGYHGEIVNTKNPSKTLICSYHSCPRLFVGCVDDKNKKYLRTYTLTEMASIQGFPKDYPFKGKEKSIIQQIGNAVPPPLITKIVKSLEDIIFNDSDDNNNSEEEKKDEDEEEEDE